MRPKLIFWFAIAILLAAGMGWLVGNRASLSRGGASNQGDKIQFYQDSMHPWIKSDKPAKCTICGMDLTPVREGEPGLEAGEGLITLSASNINVADIRTVPVRREDLRRTLRLAGTIVATDERRTNISARADGQIEKLFQENLLGHVKANSPLAYLSSKAITDLEREYIALERDDTLAALPGGEQDRQRQRAIARARLAQFGLSQEQIDALPTRTDLDIGVEVRTPVAGTVVARLVFEGTAVKEGQRMFEIVDFSKVWFQFDCYEGDMAWIAPGLEVEVTTPSAPGRVFPAKISHLDPSLGHLVRSVKGRAELENPVVMENGSERRLLREREFAEGQIKVDAPAVLSVPRTAVLSPAGKPVVYLEKAKGTYERKPVTLGRIGDEYVEILNGVSEGDMVVTRGNLLIDSQAQINQSGEQPEPTQVAEGEVLLTNVNGEQQSKTSEMFGIGVSMASALSRDNLAQFNQQIPALQNLLPAFLQAYAGEAAAKKSLEALDAASHFQQAPDLAAARKAFLSFTNALVAFAKSVRQLEAFTYLRIYHCPMADVAVPGGPKDGFWLQAAEPLANPFFGAEMLGCGNEVKPREVSKPAESPETPKAQPAPTREVVPAPPVSPQPSQPRRYP
jgi:Cu(I)/Ag(I) efflux system membrane fusion protein